MTGPTGRGWPEDGPRLPDPRMIPRREHGPRPHGSAQPEAADPAVGTPDEKEVVRPFLLTGGRTQPVHDGLRLHTMITAPQSAMYAPLRFELRQIVLLCQLPHSVAEVAADLAVPVGVARVLIADLIAGGYAYAHQQDDDAMSLEIIERIVRRVQAL